MISHSMSIQILATIHIAELHVTHCAFIILNDVLYIPNATIFLIWSAPWHETISQLLTLMNNLLIKDALYMDVYKLIPRCDVLQGPKIHNGQPVF